MAQRGEFAEHAFVLHNRYGTAQAPIDAALAAGRDVIFDVDWQGGQSLSARWPGDSLKIFILPPDLPTLEARLRQRATDTPEVIDRRIRKAKDELEHYKEYQHLIVNDDLERAYQALRAMYLTRRYGTVDRADVPHPLAELAAKLARSPRPRSRTRRSLLRLTGASAVSHRDPASTYRRTGARAGRSNVLTAAGRSATLVVCGS